MSEENKTHDLIHKIVEIIIVVAAIIGLPVYFNDLVDRKINEPEYLAKVSERVRPFLIFDQDGVYHYDSGAVAYIDSISIAHSDFLEKITVHFNTYMQNAPLLEPVGSYENYSGAIPTRGRNKIWLFTLSHTGVGLSGKYKFRLEILY